MPGFDVLNEIGRGDGGLAGIQAHHDIPETGLQLDGGIGRRRGGTGLPGENRQQRQAQDKAEGRKKKFHD